MSADSRYDALPRDQGERTSATSRNSSRGCEDAACRRELAAAPARRRLGGRLPGDATRYPKEEARFFQFKEHQALARAQAWLTQMGIPFPPAAQDA